MKTTCGPVTCDTRSVLVSENATLEHGVAGPILGHEFTAKYYRFPLPMPT